VIELGATDDHAERSIQPHVRRAARALHLDPAEHHRRDVDGAAQRLEHAEAPAAQRARARLVARVRRALEQRDPPRETFASERERGGEAGRTAAHDEDRGPPHSD
jgi:hypothetical protein